jgi:hypothetical protein
MEIERCVVQPMGMSSEYDPALMSYCFDTTPRVVLVIPWFDCITDLESQKMIDSPTTDLFTYQHQKLVIPSFRAVSHGLEGIMVSNYDIIQTSLPRGLDYLFYGSTAVGISGMDV